MYRIPEARRNSLETLCDLMNVETYEEMELVCERVKEKPMRAALEEEAKWNIIQEALAHHTSQQPQEEQEIQKEEPVVAKEEHNTKGFSRTSPPEHMLTDLEKPEGMDAFDASLGMDGSFVRFADGFARSLQGMNIQHAEALLSWKMRPGYWALPKGMSQVLRRYY
mmetsp:Transcript_26985/g.58126  ORF Transcript_26985/g.58126 Transcript_26985/m.58126 type:complete len:166 (-) Transcript_26985:36-533(-)